MENRAFEEMRKAAKARLADKDPYGIAQRAGVDFDGSVFAFETLGQKVTVSFPDYEIEPPLNDWHQLVILHYLDLADGSDLTGQWITFAEQKDGLARGSGFDRKTEDCIRRSIGKLEPEVLLQRCKALGGREVPSNADLRVEMPFLPMYPVTLNLWFADEDFDASGRLLLDRSAERYLTIEDSVTAGELVLAAIESGEAVI